AAGCGAVRPLGLRSWVSDREGGQGPGGVAGVVAQGGGEVDRPGAAQRANGEVAQGRHDVGAGAGADLGAVLGEAGVADVVQAVLDRPVPAEVVGEPGGAGLGEGEAGDRIDGHGPPPPSPKLAGLAGDLEDLGGVREPEVVDGDGLEGAQLDPAVAAVAGAVQDRDAMPGQAGAAVQQGGLVGLDDKQVVGLFGYEELRRLGVGLERVGGDHDTGQVQVGQQRPQPGNLARWTVDLSLGEDGAGGGVHRGEDGDLPALR